MPAGTFENYLLFSGAVNLGFTLFTQLRVSISRDIAALADKQISYYATVVDSCTRHTECHSNCSNTHCRRNKKHINRNGKEGVKNGKDHATEDDIKKLTQDTSSKIRIRIKQFEKCSTFLSIICVITVSIILCADLVEAMYSWPFWGRFVYGSLFMIPFILMTLVLLAVNRWSLSSNKNEVEKYIISAYCLSALRCAKKATPNDSAELELEPTEFDVTPSNGAKKIKKQPAKQKPAQ